MMLPGPLMLPPRMLAMSRHRLEARMEARRLCLLPSRTEMESRVGVRSRTPVNQGRPQSENFSEKQESNSNSPISIRARVTSVISITYISTFACILCIGLPLVAFEAITASKQPLRSKLTSDLK